MFATRVARTYLVASHRPNLFKARISDYDRRVPMPGGAAGSPWIDVDQTVTEFCKAHGRRVPDDSMICHIRIRIFVEPTKKVNRIAQMIRGGILRGSPREAVLYTGEMHGPMYNAKCAFVGASPVRLQLKS